MNITELHLIIEGHTPTRPVQDPRTPAARSARWRRDVQERSARRGLPLGRILTTRSA